jgi:hypothetical protein
MYRNHIISIFIVCLSVNCFSQTYIWKKNESNPRWKISLDDIYEINKSKQELVMKIKGNSIYEVYHSGYDRAGNPSLVGGGMIFQFYGNPSKCYMYFGNEYNQRLKYIVKNGTCYEVYNNDSRNVEKLMIKEGRNVFYTNDNSEFGNYDLAGRYEVKSGSEPPIEFIFYLINLKRVNE